jgi:type IV secretory pathway VirB2 component (pilin)
MFNLFFQKAYAQTIDWKTFVPSNLSSLTAQTLITNIVQVLLIVAGLVAFVYLIIGGYQYITAGGNADQATAARSTILNAIIGIVIVFASYAILSWFMSYFLTGKAPTTSFKPSTHILTFDKK